MKKKKKILIEGITEATMIIETFEDNIVNVGHRMVIYEVYS